MREMMPYAEYEKVSQEYHEKFRTYNRRKKKFFEWYFRIYHRLEVRGAENIPAGPVIIAPNHSGGYDLDLLAVSHFSHPVREITPMIIDSWHFINSGWGRWYVGWGMPVWTGTGLNYEYLDPFLAPGGGKYPGIVAIFPEGNVPHYRDRHVLGMFYPGVVRMALRYRVPIVPAAMVGFDKANPIMKVIPHENRPDDLICLPFTLPFKCIVEFGKPVYLNDYYDMNPSKEEEFWIANEVVRPHLCTVLDKYNRTAMAPVTAPMKRPL
ncbi:MAG: hypothetical protein CVV44_11145 [Spirochaetae bacterium HGW-Spirochaetae-1]|jgi:1-acyl-sn-glycerol-3-phosphate acyltransferase|nr:MAG: hypothetical protein CVV44_11145 [Spirochaetae bacterium HGW-Spirochaetae-1]